MKEMGKTRGMKGCKQQAFSLSLELLFLISF
jgi:hypothetical protein